VLSSSLRIVAVEEHFTWQDLLSRIDPAILVRNGWPAPGTAVFQAINPPALTDTGKDRITSMNAAGISTQVLSVPGPRAEIVHGADGIAIAREFNDRMARLISAEPEHFAAFAHLPMRSPSAAADELERAVIECGLKGALISGTIDGKFLDAPEFTPVLARAERLDVPLYIHRGYRRRACAPSITTDSLVKPHSASQLLGGDGTQKRLSTSCVSRYPVHLTGTRD
jgi:predicted TIM-barrel fold metal-dependent hydrolase